MPKEGAVIFWLGTHQPQWLGRTAVPLFLSRRRLALRRRLARAAGPWAIDSGGFSELLLFGGWRTEPAAYVAEVRRWRDEVGRLEWAAIQDWMCEPAMLARTGLDVAEHQRRTCDSWDRLRDLAPDLPWVPVLQGWAPEDYERHADLYDRRGTSLAALPLVGVGTMCRRGHTGPALRILGALHRRGLRLHGFGLKSLALDAGAARVLASSDSLAWSAQARRAPPLAGCAHASCANCMRYALLWRERLLARAVPLAQVELRL